MAVLDQMYDKNLDYYKQLTMYILAGQEKLAQERNGTLVELRQKAQQTGLPEDAQRANDYANLCERFEKKLHDLELTRMISIQMGPQIRMLQNSDTVMSRKNSDQHCQHHPPLEEPDGAGAGHSPRPAGHGGPADGHQHDQ